VEEAARERGMPSEWLVKCILLTDGAGRYVLAAVTGDARLDPQAVRAQLPPGWRRLRFASAEEIRAVTGYAQGAVAPLALPAGLPLILDQAIAGLGRVSISSGDPIAGLELSARDLIRASGATLAPISRSDQTATVPSAPDGD
jgi:Cys-tRNA(Pro)/Cys-tRNA(Cys) deacylase